jgi:GNAT superfamily N-acetyltransferase
VEFQIRTFAEADRAAVIAMCDTIYPEYREGGWHAAEQFDSERFTSYRYVAEARHLLGYAAIRYLRQGHGRVDLMVLPEWRRRGVGTGLMKRLLQDLRSVNSVAAHARVREDHEEALSFLRNRGFTEHQRMYGLRLCIAEAELDRCWPLVNLLQAEGIQISTFAEERTRDARC